MGEAINMKSDVPPSSPAEIELKLAVPTADPSQLVQRLAKTALLSRRKAIVRHLHNVYFDTPDQRLHQARIALRIRRVGNEAHPQWLQTLKMGGANDSALSQRGEWETEVAHGALDLQALKATPWAQLDPDGKIFQALAPCFITRFDRTSWLVHKRDGSAVEVALDVGQVVAGAYSAPICELELELLSGQPAALFDIARTLARTLAVLPANISKAERGYALAQNALDKPVRARPPELTPELAVHAAAGRVLREMFSQFTSNLNALRASDAPEVVHQARVGWRRFKSALRLFKPVLDPQAIPAWQTLRPLLDRLGALRDLDVAAHDTLPLLAEAFTQSTLTQGKAQRMQAWEATVQHLATAAAHQRQAVRTALQTPAIGATLLATTQWLEELPVVDTQQSLQPWARQRIRRFHERLKAAAKAADSAESQHRVRILAKRLRYAIEALRPLLWERRARRWHAQATALQTSMGAVRDIAQAGVLVAKLDADHGLAEFLRGVALGQSMANKGGALPQSNPGVSGV